MLVVVLKATFGIHFRSCIFMPTESYYVMCWKPNKWNKINTLLAKSSNCLHEVNEKPCIMKIIEHDTALDNIRNSQKPYSTTCGAKKLNHVIWVCVFKLWSCKRLEELTGRFKEPHKICAKSDRLCSSNNLEWVHFMSVSPELFTSNLAKLTNKQVWKGRILADVQHKWGI